jgi:DNA-binding NarL/FixJ family response regulator
LTATKAARVLIVDDHPIVRQGLTQLIDGVDDLEVCGEAHDATSASEALDRLRPDVAIVDLMLEGTAGLAFIKELKRRYPDTPLLVLSMHDEAVYAERALKAGAYGYIMKEAATSQLLTALRKVLAGEVYVSEHMVARILRRMVGGSASEGIEQLSDRELEVFQWIGRGLSINEIAERLKVSPKTVESFRAHIKDKLNLANSAEVARLAVRWFEQRRARP